MADIFTKPVTQVKLRQFGKYIMGSCVMHSRSIRARGGVRRALMNA